MNFRTFAPFLFVVLASMISQAAFGQNSSITLLVRDDEKQPINDATVIVESYLNGQDQKTAEKILELGEQKDGGVYTAGNTETNKNKSLQFIVLAVDRKEKFRVSVVKDIDGSFENRLAIIPPLFEQRDEDALIRYLEDRCERATDDKVKAQINKQLQRFKKFCPKKP